MDLKPILDTIKEIFKIINANTIYTVLVTALSVLGSTGAWKYYEKRASIKEKEEQDVKHDYNQRIEKLEKKQK